MSHSASTRIKIIGSASLLALTAGLGSSLVVPAYAQSAPDPVVSAPTPTPPMPPANAEDCVNVAGTVTCAPGTDADGFFDITGSSIVLDVQAGSVVQGPIIVTGATTGSVDGAIITSFDFDDALLLGGNSAVTINGYVQTSGSNADAVETEVGSSVTNNGTIYTTGANSDGVALAASSSFTNTGIVQTLGGGSEAVFAFGDDVVVTNGVTGSIFTSGTNAAGIAVANGATVTNAGLIQTFGFGAEGITAGTDAVVDNSGNIVTGRNQASGVVLGDNGTLANSGLIATSGALADAVLLGTGGTLTNSGTVQADGTDSFAVFGAGDGIAIDNTASGSILANGDGGFGISLGNGGMVTNAGLIATTGDFAYAVDALANATVSNTGTISTTGIEGVAIFTGANSTIGSDGAISTQGTDAFGILARPGSSVTLGASSTLTTAGNGAGGVIVFGNGTVANAGAISTGGSDAAGVAVTGVGTVTNTGTIATTGGQSAGVQVANNSSVNNSGSITTTGDEFSDAVVLGRGSDLINSGLVQADGRDSFAVFGAADRVSVTNTATGSILANGDGGFGIAAGNDAVVTNAGTIATTGEFGIGLDMLANATVTNSGTISTTGEGATAIFTGANANITNSGTISTQGADAFAILARPGSTITLDTGSAVSTVGGGAGGVIVYGDGSLSNAGSITTLGLGAQGVTMTGGGTVTNSGSIAAAQGRALDMGHNAEVTNEAGGSIVSGSDEAIRFGASGTLVNAGLIEGSIGVLGSERWQIVTNSGSIEGTSGTAVALGAGNDEFRLDAGSLVTGTIDLGDDDDVFYLAWDASAVDGLIDGGNGNDLAVLAGNLDADNFAGFENYTLGSLGALRISGDRSLTGDVSVDGEVILGLGVDSLTTTGAMVLENGSTITIETPLDAALLGQTVRVFEAGGGLTDNGATITIVDDDLLVDYVTAFGSGVFEVVATNPLSGSSDSNVAAFGGALQSKVAEGSLSTANFVVFNALDASELEAAVVDALPSLNGGEAREIFESATTASHALNTHLASGKSGVWGEVVVRGAEQDALSLSAGGYDSDQLIFTVGADAAMGDAAQLGVIASYAKIDNTDFTGNGVRGETDVESIKLGAYAGLAFAERGFVNGEVAYLTGSIENERAGLVGAIGSEYDFDGFAYRAVIGFDLLPDENVSITPTVGISGAMLSFDDAVETGGFGFTVERQDADFAELRGGVEVAAQVSPGVSGYVRGTVVHDLNDEARSFQLTSTDTGSFAVALPGQERDRFELAAGAAIELSPNASVELGYLGDFADGYDGHSAQIGLRLAF